MNQAASRAEADGLFSLLSRPYSLFRLPVVSSDKDCNKGFVMMWLDLV